MLVVVQARMGHRGNSPEAARELLTAEARALATGVKQQRKIQETQVILWPLGNLELASDLGVWLELLAVTMREESTPSGSREGKSSGERMGVCKGMTGEQIGEAEYLQGNVGHTVGTSVISSILKMIKRWRVGEA